jgi:hypothetical protein
MEGEMADTLARRLDNQQREKAGYTMRQRRNRHR